MIPHKPQPQKTLRWLPMLLWLVPVGFLALFYFYPLGSILSASFARGEGTVWQTFAEAVSSRRVRGVVGFTIGQAVASTLLTLLLGLPGAYLLGRFEFKGKKLLRVITSVPFVMPTLVVAAGFNALLGPQGWVNQAAMQWFGFSSPPIQFINTLGAILIAHVFYNTTIVLRIVGDFWGHLNPRLSDAARMLGASRWEAMRRVTLPLLAPAIAAASLLVFIFDFSSFAVILVLGGPGFSTIETEIFYQASGVFNMPLAAALSVIQLAVTLGLMVVYTRLTRRISRPMQMRSRQSTEMRLDTPRKRMAAGGFIAFLLVLLTSPLIALAARSVTQLGLERTRDGVIPQGITLAFYQALGDMGSTGYFTVSPIRAVGVSLQYAAVTVVLALLMGLPAAWLLARNRDTWMNKILDPLLMLPLGTSAVTLGLGFIVALNRPPLDLRASPILIPLAHTLVAFPFVVRSLVPALQSIHPRMRQSAQMLGASPAQVWRFIDLPLVGRAVIVSAAFAFTISMGEFGATSLIARPEFPTIPMAIYRLLSRPGAMNYGQGLALSTILMVITTVGILAIERFRLGEVGEF